MSKEKEERLRNTSFSPEERNLKKMDEEEESKKKTILKIQEKSKNQKLLEVLLK